jgi:hypothetical protein
MTGSSKQRGMNSDISAVKRRRASAERMREARVCAEKDVLIGELETSKAISDKAAASRGRQHRKVSLSCTSEPRHS